MAYKIEYQNRETKEWESVEAVPYDAKVGPVSQKSRRAFLASVLGKYPKRRNPSKVQWRCVNE